MSARSWLVAQVAATLLTVAGLAIDAYIHFDLASGYDAIRTSNLSQGDLFRVEAVVATLAALAVLARPRRYTALFAFLTAAAGLAAVLLYRYVDIQAIGPFPAMYEPVWFSEKTVSAYGEGVAAAAAAGLLILLHVRRRR